MVKLSDAATAKLTSIMAEQGAAYGLRLSAIPGGCSGYQYGMELAEAEREGDWVGTFGTVKVLVSADSKDVLDGVEIDYVETLERTGFTIHNPKAVRSCGCGKSFDTEEGCGSSGGHHSH